MTRKTIIEELAKRGYTAEKHNVTKNGVLLKGIIIRTDDSNTFPIIYTDELIKENQSVSEVANIIISIYNNKPKLDLVKEMLGNKENILNHIFVGLQKTSTENIIKEDTAFRGIESYLFIRRDLCYGICATKVSKELLESYGITEKDAWERAKANTDDDVDIIHICKMMSEYMGADMGVAEEDLPVYVVTNKDRYRGASAILNSQAFINLKAKYNTNKFLVMPSSVHEMIVTPYTEDMDKKAYANMVRTINSKAVEPTEQLTDTAYELTI